MGERFYPARLRSTLGAAGLVALLCACGQDPAPAPAPQEGASPWFPPLERLAAPYQPPAEDELLPRLLEHLRGASRDSLHFALEHVPEFGEEAARALVAGIEERIPDPDQFGSLHNYAKALSGCGSAADAPVLVRVLRESPVPLARTGAAETLGEIGLPEHAAVMIELIGIETESGPFQAYFSTLRELGGAEAGDFLVDKVADWAAGRPGGAAAGNLAWAQLLAMEDEGAAARLAEAAGLLEGLSFQASSWRRRAELGDSSVAPDLRGLLDPAVAPAVGTRVVAVEGLGFAGDWEGVQLAFADPDPRLQLAAVNALSLPEARESRVAHGKLEELARGADTELAQAAMHALCLRGDRRLLEPWLLRAREYPHGPGSVNAINLLKHEDARDPRTVPVLLQAWEHSDEDSRIGLLRVFGSMKDERCLPLIRELVLGEEPSSDLRRMAITQLANLDELGLPILIEYLQQPLEVADTPHAVAALATLAQRHDEAREMLIDWALDPERPDHVRAQLFPLLVKVLGLEAYPVLSQAREQSRRPEVRAALERILVEFF